MTIHHCAQNSDSGILSFLHRLTPLERCNPTMQYVGPYVAEMISKQTAGPGIVASAHVYAC